MPAASPAWSSTGGRPGPRRDGPPGDWPKAFHFQGADGKSSGLVLWLGGFWAPSFWQCWYRFQYTNLSPGQAGKMRPPRNAGGQDARPPGDAGGQDARPPRRPLQAGRESWAGNALSARTCGKHLKPHPPESRYIRSIIGQRRSECGSGSRSGSRWFPNQTRLWVLRARDGPGCFACRSVFGPWAVRRRKGVTTPLKSWRFRPEA